MMITTSENNLPSNHAFSIGAINHRGIIHWDHADIYEDDFNAFSLRSSKNFSKISQRFMSSMNIKLMPSDCYLHQVIQS